MSLSDTLKTTDDLIKEYLIFRGFTDSLKNFELESKRNDDFKYRVDRIVEEVILSVKHYDIDRLMAVWHFLNTKIFTSLTEYQSKVADDLESDIHRLFLVYCIQNNQKDKCSLFLERMSDSIQRIPDWFSIPFVAEPAKNEKFQKYFTKQWQDFLIVSLHNFIAVALHKIQMPTLAASVRKLLNLTGNEEIEEDNAAEKSFQFSTSDDLMDDFSIIAQGNQSELPRNRNDSTSRSSLKAILKSVAGKKELKNRSSTK